MSCLIVSDACMTKAVRAIVSKSKRSGMAVITRFANISTDYAYAGRDIGRALFRLNAKAYASRYPEEARGTCLGADTFDFADYRPMSDADLIEAYKGLECVRYNCAEEGCLEDPLFVAMDEALPILAALIVENLETYRAAPWGD